MIQRIVPDYQAIKVIVGSSDFQDPKNFKKIAMALMDGYFKDEYERDLYRNQSNSYEIVLKFISIIEHAYGVSINATLFTDLIVAVTQQEDHQYQMSIDLLEILTKSLKDQRVERFPIFIYDNILKSYNKTEQWRMSEKFIKILL